MPRRTPAIINRKNTDARYPCEAPTAMSLADHDTVIVASHNPTGLTARVAEALAWTVCVEQLSDGHLGPDDATLTPFLLHDP